MPRTNYEELTFTNSFIFSKVMTNNPEICKELTEVFFDGRIREIATLSDDKYSIDTT